MTFDHADAGTPETAWAASEVLGGRCSLDDAAIAALLVVAAHPDDETLGAAGLVARCAARGTPVTILVLTDGEASHPQSPTWRPDDLATLRRAELVTAVGRIAPRAEVQFLALGDGGLREQTDVVRRRVEEVVEASELPITLVAPWTGDGHRDHRVAGECARQVAASHGLDLLEYPVWFWHWGVPGATAAESAEAAEGLPWSQVQRVELSAQEQRAKAWALAAHTSQTEPLSPAPGDEVMLGEHMLAHFERTFETFVVTPRPAAGTVAQPGTVEQHPTTEQPGTGEQPSGSLDAAFFDDFYAGRTDPWGFQTRWYEERKRAITLAALPRRRFASGLEVGCSIGVLTAALAERCDRLLGIDISSAPLAQARSRTPATVSLAQLATPHEWPEGAFDLIVLSEVGYYCSAADLDLMLTQVIGSLTPDGVVLACHWRHPVAEYPLGGDEVHAELAARPEFARTVRHEEEDFLLEVYSRPPARSVAVEAGLA